MGYKGLCYIAFDDYDSKPKLMVYGVIFFIGLIMSWGLFALHSQTGYDLLFKLRNPF